MAEENIHIKDTLTFLKSSSSDLLKAKVELAAIEMQEAANLTLRKVIYGVVSAVFGLFTYLLLMVSIIGIAGFHLKGRLGTLENYMASWSAVALTLFFLHLLIVFIFIDKLKSASKQTLFALTKAEIEKDKQWLQKIKTNSKS